MIFSHLGGYGPPRMKSVQGTSQCRWVSAIPWQRNGQFNLTNAIYRVAVARRYRMAKPAPAQAPIACKCGVNKGMPGLDSMGDHEDAVCTALQGARTQAHNRFANQFATFLRECHFSDGRLEIRDWDAGDLSVNLHHRPRATTTNGLPSNRRTNPDKSKRVPEVCCTSPDGLTEYVIRRRKQSLAHAGDMRRGIPFRHGYFLHHWAKPVWKDSFCELNVSERQLMIHPGGDCTARNPPDR